MFSVVVEPTWIWVTFLEPQNGWLSAENARWSVNQKSPANEDASDVTVISTWDAGLTYLQC